MQPMERRPYGSIFRISLIGVVVASLALLGWKGYQLSRPTVSVTTLVRGPVLHAVYATGTVQPKREYAIRTPIAGTIEHVRVDKGQTVDAGAELAVVTDPELKFRLERATAELSERKSRVAPVLAELDAKIKARSEQLDIAKREMERATEMQKRDAGSSVDVDRASDRLQTNWSELESLRSQRTQTELQMQKEIAVAESAVSIAQWNVNQQVLKSPVAGTVLERPRSAGTRVAINDDVLRLADVRPQSLVIRAAVDEEDITRVNVGQRVIVTLYAFNEGFFEGTVDEIYPQADAVRRTFEVDIVLKSDERTQRLQAGMTGELAFVVAEKPDVSVLPAQAWQDGVVYVLRDGFVRKTDAVIGIRAVDRIEVVSGLSDGDQVIITPVTSKMVDQTARSVSVDPRTAAGLNKPKEPSSFKGMGG
jgi:HlyD family secretion protein